MLLRDADILEQLGAIGILRVVRKVGRDTRFTYFADAIATLARNLKKLPPLLNLPSAAMVAAARIRILESFIAAAKSEAMGHGL
jgi:uncharacterized protein